jgi:sacsin
MCVPTTGTASLQEPIMSFVSAGGGGSGVQQLDAFFRRLASTADADLPSSIGRVQLSLSAACATPAAPATGDAASDDRQLQQLAAGGVEEEVVCEEWLVCNQLGGGAAKQLALETWKSERVKMNLPWIGVAAQLTSTAASGGSRRGRSLSCGSGTAGRAFCFLPLPAETHLPVHINGFFELSSNRCVSPDSQELRAPCGAPSAANNLVTTRRAPPPHTCLLPHRRDVWHGDDMSGAGRRRAVWNEALLNGAIAQAYAALLQEACQLLGPGPDFWRLLPLGQGVVPQPWLQVAAALYARIAGLPLLYSPVHGGCWLPPRRVLLPDAACYDVPGGDASDAPLQQQAADMVVGFVPDAQQPSFLAQLLVQCGLPLVMGLTQAQQACMLQWSAASARLDPAAARALLASNAQLVVAAVERRHTRPEPAAAVLLRYALSDVSAADEAAPGVLHRGSSSREQPQQQASNSTQLAASSFLQALKQLNGLPLLPLADGRVQALAVGLHTPSTAAAARQQQQPAVCYVPTSAEERQLLARLQHHMLHDGVLPDVHKLLLCIARARSTNMHEITSHRLDEHLLALLLPPAWHSSSGLDEVAWQPPEDTSATGLNVQPAADEAGAAAAAAAAGDTQQQQQQRPQPSRAFIRLLWQWLASRTDAAEIRHWPILPSRGGKLRLLKQPAQVRSMGCLAWPGRLSAGRSHTHRNPAYPHAAAMPCLLPPQVLRAGEQLPEQLLSALNKLGCCLLDTSVLDGLSCPALSAFVQEPTAAGLLDALAAAQALAAAAQAARLSAQHEQPSSASSIGSSVQHSWQQQLQQLTGAERHQLRHHLLQAKWFSSTAAADAAGDAAGLTAQRLQMLRCLPIFEVHQPLPYEDDSGSITGQEQLAASSAAAAASVRTYVALAGPSSSREPVLLPPPGISNGQVLGSRFLKCESDSEEAALQQLGVRQLSMREWVAGHLAKAPHQLQQRALTATVAHILANIPQLAAADAALPAAMRELPLIPTRAAAAAGSSGARLAAPSALFDRHNTVFELLLDPLKHFPAAPFDGSSSGGAAAAAHSQALLKGLTLCGLRTQLTLEVLVLAARSIAEHAADDATPHTRAQQLLHHLDDWARSHSEPSGVEAALWRELQGIAWCPVLLTPPERGLPWPHHIPEKQQEQEQLAAPAQPAVDHAPAEPPPPPQQQEQQEQQVLRMPPKMVAPADMAWLASAPLRLLAAPCPSSALCQLLGWTHSQVLRPAVAVAQLVQMGVLYPAGQVGRWCCRRRRSGVL